MGRGGGGGGWVVPRWGRCWPRWAARRVPSSVVPTSRGSTRSACSRSTTGRAIPSSRIARTSMSRSRPSWNARPGCGPGWPDDVPLWGLGRRVLKQAHLGGVLPSGGVHPGDGDGGARAVAQQDGAQRVGRADRVAAHGRYYVPPGDAMVVRRGTAEGAENQRAGADRGDTRRHSGALVVLHAGLARPRAGEGAARLAGLQYLLLGSAAA